MHNHILLHCCLYARRPVVCKRNAWGGQKSNNIEIMHRVGGTDGGRSTISQIIPAMWWVTPGCWKQAGNVTGYKKKERKQSSNLYSSVKTARLRSILGLNTLIFSHTLYKYPFMFTLKRDVSTEIFPSRARKRKKSSGDFRFCDSGKLIQNIKQSTVKGGGHTPQTW